MTNKHDIIWADKVDSTNNEARRRIAEIDNMSVLSAIEQTSGRGQRGNVWSSAAGENLTFSVILKFASEHLHADRLPPMPAYNQFAISEIAALSVVDYLAQNGIEAMIKWPNDIYVGNKKICGILIENSLLGRFMSWSIVGIGLNVNQIDFPDSLQNPTSMLAESGKVRDIRICLKEFMDIFGMYVRRYANINDGLSKLHRLYLPLMWRKDEPHLYSDNMSGEMFNGRIIGLSEDGRLKLKDEDGKIRVFGFKEINYL